MLMKPDHCIDQLRQALMCHGDVSLYVLRWNSYGHYARPRYDTERTCRNFDKIREWSDSRTVEGWFRGDRLLYAGDHPEEEDDPTVLTDRSGGNRSVATYFSEL